MANPFFLYSDRLQFRLWTHNDSGLAKDLWGAQEVTKYIGGPFSLRQINERLQKEITNDSQYGVQYWPVFLRHDNTFIGCCGLRPYKDKKKVMELGFHLRSEHWGKGYATEAAKSIISYAFEELKIIQLFAGHHPNNAGSKKALIKLGFQYIHDQYYPPTGLNHPSYELSYENYRWNYRNLK